MAASKPSQAAIELAARYGVDLETLASFGAFESEVVHGTRPDGPIVLKIFNAARRTQDQVHAELDWLRSLRAENLPVVEPVPSLAGRWIEPVTDDQGTATHGAAYRRASGAHVPYAEWRPELIERFGNLIGHLHRHTRTNVPTGPLRPTWRELDALDEAQEAYADDPEMLAAIEDVRPAFQAVGKGLGENGLIHADAHAWNVLIDGDDLTLVDFDDAVMGPYLYDLAVVLYYAVATRPKEDPAASAAAFLTPFLRGFDAVVERPQGSAEDVATLLAMRRTDLAIAVHTHLPKEKWDDDIRAAAERLRKRTIERHELVPLDTLKKFFG